jgi:hypothetical protein
MTEACIAGDVSLLQRWAKRGVSVSNAEPLVEAAANGQLDAVRVLLWELGADVSELYDCFSPLYVAAQYGHEHVVRYLLKE